MGGELPPLYKNRPLPAAITAVFKKTRCAANQKRKKKIKPIAQCSLGWFE
jgi:hypothetical protein